MLPIRKDYFDSVFDNFIDKDDFFDNMKCDIYEKDNTYYIEVDLPGIRKEDINIDFENGYLTIVCSKHRENDEDDNKKYLKRERFYGTCTRRFYVGNVDQTKILAKFDNNILLISVPKKDKLVNKTSIDIK